MPANPIDVQKAKVIVDDLLDKKKYPCGNPIGGKTWSKAASLITGDPAERSYWTEHGHNCLNKAAQNVENLVSYETRMAEYNETQKILAGLQPKIVNEIRRDQSFTTKYASFFRMFPKFETQCVEASKAGQTRRCHYCQVDIPKGKNYQSVVHSDGECTTKTPSTDWVTPAATSDTLSEDAVYVLKNLKTKTGLILANEPDIHLVAFRCNDLAAVMAAQLYRVGTGPHFEVIRIGDDSNNCHYFLVIGRQLRKGEDEDSPTKENLMAGTDGSPLTVFGEDAIMMDPWATKHTPDFSKVAIGMNGINYNLKEQNKWMVQPHAFGGTVYSICLFD